MEEEGKNTNFAWRCSFRRKVRSFSRSLLSHNNSVPKSSDPPYFLPRLSLSARVKQRVKSEMVGQPPIGTIENKEKKK